MQFIISRLSALGKQTLTTIAGLGRAVVLLVSAIVHWPSPKKGLPLLINQLYAVGWLSLIIIVVSGTFIGMVLTCRILLESVSTGMVPTPMICLEILLAGMVSKSMIVL